MDSSKNILEKIRKLYLKQESAKNIGSIAEAETFAAKVQELLAKYNLSLTDVDLTDKEREEGIEEYFTRVMYPTIGGQSSYDVMRVIAKYNFCHAYIFGKKSNDKMQLLGTKENLEVCKYIHTIVSRIFIAEAKKEHKVYSKASKIGGDIPVGYDTFARTFIAGAAKGLNDKLESEREVFKTNNVKAGAVMKMNDVAIRGFMLGKYKIGKSTKRSLSKAGGAYGSGYETGKNVKLTQGLTGNTKPIDRKLLG